jgi:hypothetical protein
MHMPQVGNQKGKFDQDSNLTLPLQILAVAVAFQIQGQQRPPGAPPDRPDQAEVLSNCTSGYTRCSIPASTLALLEVTGTNNPAVEIKDYA